MTRVAKASCKFEFEMNRRQRLSEIFRHSIKSNQMNKLSNKKKQYRRSFHKVRESVTQSDFVLRLSRNPVSYVDPSDE